MLHSLLALLAVAWQIALPGVHALVHEHERGGSAEATIAAVSTAHGSTDVAARASVQSPISGKRHECTLCHMCREAQTHSCVTVAAVTAAPSACGVVPIEFSLTAHHRSLTSAAPRAPPVLI